MTTDPTKLADCRKRIIDCKESLLRLCPAGHQKTHVLDSFLSYIDAKGQFSYNQGSYLLSIEDEVKKLAGIQGDYERFVEGNHPWTPASLSKTIATALTMLQGYNSHTYYWKKHRLVLEEAQRLLDQGDRISLKHWSVFSKLGKFDNLADAYAHGAIFRSGDLVQLRASINPDDILMEGYGNYGRKQDLYSRRRKLIATVIEYDSKPPVRLIQTTNAGGCRVVKILPVGSVEAVCVTERDLKKVPSKVTAGGGQ